MPTLAARGMKRPGDYRVATCRHPVETRDLEFHGLEALHRLADLFRLVVEMLIEAEGRIEAAVLEQILDERRRRRERDVAVGAKLRKRAVEQSRCDFADIVEGERVEDDGLVDAVPQLRRH